MNLHDRSLFGGIFGDIFGGIFAAIFGGIFGNIFGDILSGMYPYFHEIFVSSRNMRYHVYAVFIDHYKFNQIIIGVRCDGSSYH